MNDAPDSKDSGGGSDATGEAVKSAPWMAVVKTAWATAGVWGSIGVSGRSV